MKSSDKTHIASKAETPPRQMESDLNSLRVKIAALLGVKCRRCNGTGEYLRYGQHEWFRLNSYAQKGEQQPVKCDHVTRDDEWGHYPKLPNWPEDLNACAEFEKMLTTVWLQNSYQARIAEICYADEERANNQVVFNQLTATAEQRCRAFVAVMEASRLAADSVHSGNEEHLAAPGKQNPAPSPFGSPTEGEQ